MRPTPNLIPNIVEFAEEYGWLVRQIESVKANGRVGAVEGRVLRLLLDRPMFQSEVRRELGVDSGQTSRLFTSLRTKGLTCHLGGSPGRRPVTLTPQGQFEARAAVGCLYESAAATLRELDGPARERFLASCRLLGESLDALPTAVRIRDAEPGETGVLIREAVRNFTQDYYGYDHTLEGVLLGRFSRLLATKHLVLVAERQRSLIGGLALLVDKKTSTGKIEYFAMFLFEHGCGWGGQLLDVAAERAKALGLKRLLIEFPVSRDGDSYFKGREGWLREGAQPKWWCGICRKWETWSRSL